MPTNLKADAKKILDTAGASADFDVVSCSGGETAPTDDDKCLLEERDISRFLNGNAASSVVGRKEVPVDGLFSLANAVNLKRVGTNNVQGNYFLRLAPNFVFYRNESVDRSNLAEGGFFYRPEGSAEWRRVEHYKDVPELKDEIVPILIKAIQSRADYERLNGKPHHGNDFGFVQAKAIAWLNNLVPEGDDTYRDALLRISPGLSGDAAFYASLRLKSELRNVAPEDRSLMPALRLQFAAESIGAFYAPLPLREYPAGSGKMEPMGSLVQVGLGVQLCLGSAVECALREGVRVGFLGEVGRMQNGFGSWSFGGKAFVGNEYFTGFLEAAASMYPTGGWLQEGERGELIFKPSLGVGLRAVPFWDFGVPVGVLLGSRTDPSDPLNTGIYGGLGGTY
jgi:hypothetical protein